MARRPSPPDHRERVLAYYERLCDGLTVDPVHLSATCPATGLSSHRRRTCSMARRRQPSRAGSRTAGRLSSRTSRDRRRARRRAPRRVRRTAAHRAWPYRRGEGARRGDLRSRLVARRHHRRPWAIWADDLVLDGCRGRRDLRRRLSVAARPAITRHRHGAGPAGMPCSGPTSTCSPRRAGRRLRRRRDHFPPAARGRRGRPTARHRMRTTPSWSTPTHPSLSPPTHRPRRPLGHGDRHRGCRRGRRRGRPRGAWPLHGLGLLVLAIPARSARARRSVLHADRLFVAPAAPCASPRRLRGGTPQRAAVKSRSESATATIWPHVRPSDEDSSYVGSTAAPSGSVVSEAQAPTRSSRPRPATRVPSSPGRGHGRGPAGAGAIQAHRPARADPSAARAA